jgi:hypothetical protein
VSPNGGSPSRQAPGTTGWLLRLVALAWLPMAISRFGWCYHVAERMWHGQDFAAGPWSRLVNCGTVLAAPVGALLIWTGRELSGTTILLFLSVAGMSLDFPFLRWFPESLMEPYILLGVLIKPLTLLVGGAHALRRANEERRKPAGA